MGTHEKKRWEREPGPMLEKVAEGGGIPSCGELMMDIPDKAGKILLSALTKPAVSAEKSRQPYIPNKAMLDSTLEGNIS
jgi:hypothetical protein